MNQKAYSIWFCALLASTLVHELRAKGVAPVSSHLARFDRSSSSEICSLQCSFNYTIPNSGITVEVVEDVLVVINSTAKAVLLLDVTAQVVVVLNGTSGAGVAIDLSTQTGVYFTSGLWTASSSTIEQFIKSLTGGLKSILTKSGGIKFSVSSAPSAVLEIINQIVLKLVSHISSNDTSSDANLGLNLIITIGKGLTILLNGTLKGLLKLIGSSSIKLTGDLASLLNILQGLSQVISQIGGSLSSLLEKGVTLDLSVILGGSNGLDVLVQLILQIGGSVDISTTLGSILNNTGSLFKLIAQLGGNSSTGINGVFIIVSDIVALINKNITVDVIINDIILYLAYSSQVVTTDLSSQLNATLSGLLSAVEHINASSSLSGLVSIVKSLINGNLTIGGINISLIITKLLSGIISSVSNLLEVVVWVVLQLQAVQELSMLIPYLLLVLLAKLNSAAGVQQLIALGIKIQVSGSSAGGIIKQLLSNSLTIVLGLLTGNIYDILAKLPTIGTIITALNSAVSSQSSGKFSLKILLDASSLVQGLIKGLIQVTTGISLGVSSAVQAQVQSVIQSSSSVSSSLHIDISVSSSSSSSGSSSSSSSGGTNSSSSSGSSWSWSFGG